MGPIAMAAALAGAPLAIAETETAIAMTRPALPARMVDDCPTVDGCDYGGTWDTCEPIPVYRAARADAAVLRTLKADEPFVALGGEIELIAPGTIAVLADTDAGDTGGLVLAQGTTIEAYGPLQLSRGLYYVPSLGKGWSPNPGAYTMWFADKKVAKMVEAPKMTWWVKVRLKDRQIGWLQLKAEPDLISFPVFGQREAVRTWDIHKVRDDETPDCGGVLDIRAGDTGAR